MLLTPVRIKLTSGILSLEEKKQLSGNFESCNFVKKELIEKLAQMIATAKETTHSTYDNKDRNDKVSEYEKDAVKGIHDMFIVDRGHAAGKELHVLKDNGVIEVYNVDKLLHGRNSFITRLIARGPQISRYYKWTNCEVPPELMRIARSNEEDGKNYW